MSEACPFDLAVLQTHTQRERRFCVPRQEVCFHLSRLGPITPSRPPSRDKGKRTGMSDWDEASSVEEEEERAVGLGIQICILDAAFFRHSSLRLVHQRCVVHHKCGGGFG